MQNGITQKKKCMEFCAILGCTFFLHISEFCFMTVGKFIVYESVIFFNKKLINSEFVVDFAID